MLLRYVDAQNECANSQDRVHIASSTPHIASSLRHFARSWLISQVSSEFARSCHIASSTSRVCARSLGLFARSNPFLARLAFSQGRGSFAQDSMLYSQVQTRFAQVRLVYSQGQTRFSQDRPFRKVDTRLRKIHRFIRKFNPCTL